MPRSKKLSALIQAPGSVIKSLSGEELRTAYKSAAAALRGRRGSFEKAGELSAFEARYQSGVPGVGSFESEAQMRSALGFALTTLGSKSSTYSGYKKAQQKRRASYEKTTGRKFGSMSEFNKFGNFMGEMQTRLKSMFGPASDFIVDLFNQAERLDLNPEALMKNFEYWRDHLDDLKEMDPIEGRKNKLTPSDYIKRAKLENISDYYAETNSKGRKKHHNIISSAARKPSRGRGKRK